MNTQISRLPQKIKQSTSISHHISSKSIQSQDVELLQLLNQHQWNKSKVAKELGIGRTTLWRRLNALGLEQEGEN